MSFDCEAARAERRFGDGKATEYAEVAIILADALMDARCEERTHERLNAILDDARREYLDMVAEKEGEA